MNEMSPSSFLRPRQRLAMDAGSRSSRSSTDHSSSSWPNSSNEPVASSSSSFSETAAAAAAFTIPEGVRRALTTATATVVRRYLDNGNSGDHDNNNGPGRAGSGHGRMSSFDEQQEEEDPYEFVAFLLWYVFLVLCCIVPTCCAYRRRRLIERRITEQQHNMAHFHQQANLFLFNGNNGNTNGNGGQLLNEEALQQERNRLLTEALKPTTMTIAEGDLRELESSSPTFVKPMAWETGLVVAMHESTSSRTDNSDDNKQTENESEMVVSGTSDCIPKASTGDDDDEERHTQAQQQQTSEEVMDLEMDNNNVVLLVPIYEASTTTTTATNDKSDVTEQAPSASHVHREVAASCAICLSPYQVGDQVTWAAADAHPTTDAEMADPSNNKKGLCQHAFHTDCIIGWLSKKDEAKCPVCRQSFCRPVLPIELSPEVAVPPTTTADGSSHATASLPFSPTSAMMADDVPFSFSRSLAGTVALARFSMAIAERQQQLERQEQQPEGQSNNNNNTNAAESSSTTTSAHPSNTGTTPRVGADAASSSSSPQPASAVTGAASGEDAA